MRCLNGATITTSASNLGRALTINNAISVVVENCSFKREKNIALSAIGDVILIVNSEDITLDHVTACCSTDEILDVQNSTDVDVLYSMIVYPQHCSTHKSGSCHGYNMLATNSEVLCDHCLFASGQARLPYCQKTICTVVNSIWYNINGQGLSAVDASVVIFQGNIFLSGPNTQPEFYAVVSPNREDYLEHPAICENGNRLFGEVVYRVRRPSDRDYYVECAVVALPSEAEYWVRLNEVGAPLSDLTALIRKSIIEGWGRIVNVPFG